MDGSTSTFWPPNGENSQIVTLYGSYGNSETGGAQSHHDQGITQSSLIVPRDLNGNPSTNGAIVFLFIGFSNCDIEICGGNSDIWAGDSNQQHVYGQPCATTCPNPVFPNAQSPIPWNQPTQNGDTDIEQSFLYQVYSPSKPLVGPHVYIFDGAFGGQTLDKWDPTAIGYYSTHICSFPNPFGPVIVPECNYYRVQSSLAANGFSENQVQAIFLKASDSAPQCDLSTQHCLTGVTEPDAFTGERYMGDIMRFLRCCVGGSNSPRYPNLQQVFISSRTYGGYPTDPNHNACSLNPEPYAYEEGFSVQRLIVAQINGMSDGYSGDVHFNPNPTPGGAPWFDWGPYLWASADTPRSDGLVWCNGQTTGFCKGLRDVRYGDLFNQTMYWGDFTHPTYQGQGKVATLLVNFIQTSPWLTWILPPPPH